MSQPELPPDPDSWPADPFRLLGVARGASARDLRKAYLGLIRVYKPERAPEAFQRIRQAYESALAMTSSPTAREPEPEVPATDEPARSSFATEPGPTPTVDPWSLACRGKSEPAYRALLSVVKDGSEREETFLQLYWLGTLEPELDSERIAIDWLITGLRRVRSSRGRLRELLRRELSRNEALAMSDRVSGFVRGQISPELVEDVVTPRWRAARIARRWGLIVGDVQSLRGWLPEADSSLWAEVLLVAAANLVWADRPDSDLASAFSSEVERLAHHGRDFAEGFYRVEFAQILKAGLNRLGWLSSVASGLAVLMAGSWDEPCPTFSRQWRSHVDQIAREPRESLEALDRVQALAPAVLGRLSSLLGGLDVEEPRSRHPRAIAELMPAVGRFLAEHRWTDYRSIRLPLLRFCLREAVAPSLVARTLADRPEFVLTGKAPLSQSIFDDEPLRLLYRACEQSRQPSGRSRGFS